MSEDDYTLLKKAADKVWPEVIVTDSSLVLGLAKIAAKSILSKRGEHRSRPYTRAALRPDSNQMVS